MAGGGESVAEVNGVRMYYRHDGQGPLVVLLHGWPQTSYMWRKVMPALAERFRVVAPDLRGYGHSDKPPSGYDKRTMAADVRALVRHLGDERLHLVGHDRGARVAHRYCLDYPEEVVSVVFLDIIPTRALFQRSDMEVAKGFWHWLFHLQPDLPEILVGDNVDAYLRFFFERWTYNRAAVEEAVDHYVRAFSAPGALRAAFDDYRATFPDDVGADDECASRGQLVKAPALVLWGSAGLVRSVPVLDIWREYTTDVRGEEVPDCGHFLPEEAPGPVAERISSFVAQAERRSARGA